MSSAPQILGQPFTLPNGQVVPNRLLKSAMSECLGDGSGSVTEQHIRLYQRWADGGIGLSVTGNVMVDRGAFGELGNVAIEDERDLPMLQRWASAGTSGGGLIYVQLNHPGRQVPRFLNKQAVAPSEVPWSAELKHAMATARALTDSEIHDIIRRFAEAARICAKAGFSGVQVHGAHGYLVSQFLSPLTNLRTDGWGGSADNRRRFVVEVIRAIRAVTPAGFGVAIKMNSADFQRGGITQEEAMDTVAALDAEGLQFIEVSGGTYEAPAMMSTKPSTVSREAYFLDFAEKIRERVRTPLVVTGGFRSGAGMAEALEGGAIDLVGMARMLAIRPDFPSDLVSRPDVRGELPNVSLGLNFLDKLGAMELIFYEHQMHRMGKGQVPKVDERPIKALMSYGWANGLNALRPRRG